jgi:hypothetical protein
MLAYGAADDLVDEYLWMSETTFLTRCITSAKQ